MLGMEERCKNCRFWNTSHEWTPQGEPHECDDPRQERLRGMGVCSLASSHEDGPDNPQSLAIAEDAESYNAELVTSPEFGCVQFQPKEARPPTKLHRRLPA